MRRPCLLAALVVAALAPAVADAGTGSAARAHSARSCGSVTTVNGGRAKFVYGTKVRCSVAKRVARHARGRRYRYDGFRCKPVSGLYSCSKPGTGKGIGFSYHRP
jgi:hypothetical protein